MQRCKIPFAFPVTRPRALALSGTAVLLFLTGAVASPLRAQTAGTAVPVELPLAPTDINSSGRVVGTASPTGSTKAYSWDSTTGLKELPGKGQYSYAEAINAGGDVVGKTSGGGLGYDSGTVWPLGGTGISVFQGQLLAINDSRVATGSMIGTKSKPGPRFMIVKSVGTKWQTADLGQARGAAINNDGTIAAYDATGIFVWKPSLPNALTGSRGPYLPPLTPDIATNNIPIVAAINDSDTVVGSSLERVTTYDGQSRSNSRACLWQNGIPRALGSLPGVEPRFDGHSSSTALDINNSGTVVGASTFVSGYITREDGTLQGQLTPHAFVWDSVKGLRDLNDLVAPESGWALNEARAISDTGQIVGMGTLNGVQKGFLLTLP